MRINYIPLWAILFIGLIFISGCVAQESTTKTPPTTQPPKTPQTTPPETLNQVTPDLSGNAVPAGATLSKLHVSGNRIVNEEGQQIQLRGVHFTDPFVLEKDDLNQDGVPDNHFADITTDFERVKALGVNVVRMAIYPGFYNLVGGESYLTMYVDRVVDLAEKNGLYIILSYQVIGRPGGWYFSGADTMLADYPAKIHYSDSDMAVAFWNKVAARYGQRKHVLFEIYNEPADDTIPFTWNDWRPTGQLLIDTVRKHSDNIILGSGPSYTSDLSDVPDNPYSDSNLAYVAHVYPITVPEGEDQVSEWENRFGFLAQTYPVIVSEWGFHDGSNDEVVAGTLKGYARPFLDYLDQKNIHWIAFIYHPPDAEPPMLEKDWTTLNEFGKFVKERLQKSVPLPSGATLKTLAEKHGIRFGAFYNYDRRGSRHDQIFETEMSAMTAGTFLTDGSQTSRTEFDFSEMDTKVNWGLARNIEVHGHILVWYNDIADWVNSAPTDEVEAIMNARIDAYVKRYAGKIKVWDVVNEAVNDGAGFEWGDDGPAGTLRMKNKWTEAMGTDYIRKAFVRAHAADPTAMLRYNDYNIESNQAKFEGVKNLLIDLKKQSVPVHALGWQMHVRPENFDATTLLERMNKIADLGFDNYITELDVELPENPSAADYEKQKQTYKGVVETFLQARRHKNIVVWGIHDGDPGWLTNNHPLLFDENFNKKPAYFGVQEALQE